VKRSETGWIDVGAGAANDLPEPGGVHVKSHQLAARGRLNRGQDIEPIIRDGINDILGRQVANEGEGAPAAREHVAKKFELAAQGGGIHGRQYGAIGEGEGSGRRRS
jgi:hypothetical protein